jgi:hypothetical protein
MFIAELCEVDSLILVARPIHEIALSIFVPQFEMQHQGQNHN